MKKIWICIIIVSILAVLPMVSVVAQYSYDNPFKLQLIQEKIDDEWTGEFQGEFGYPNKNSEEPLVVGYISGFYKIGKKGGFFKGDITNKNYSKSGTMAGFFAKNIMVGKIKGDQGSLPIVGFIGFKKMDLRFGGRAMSKVGPALYFWGDYQIY